jgi:hypothetical protein
LHSRIWVAATDNVGIPHSLREKISMPHCAGRIKTPLPKRTADRVDCDLAFLLEACVRAIKLHGLS